MKKILLSIVGVLGIFGFCSAESWYNYRLSSNYNSSFNASDYEMSFFVDSPYSLNQLDEVCFQSAHTMYGFSISDGVAVVGLGDGNYFYSDSSYLLISGGNNNYETYCFTFSSPLKFESYQKIYFGLHPNNQLSSFDFYGYNTVYICRQPVNILNGGTYPESYFTGNYYNVGKENINFLGCRKNHSNWRTVDTLIFGYSYSKVVLNPKFKVNYGNTSYEYELTDDLTIKLNSPTTLSGTDTYIYDGLTGINLFYNGGSQRYNKSKLYLSNSMYYFYNNVFSPLCP